MNQIETLPESPATITKTKIKRAIGDYNYPLGELLIATGAELEKNRVCSVRGWHSVCCRPPNADFRQKWVRDRMCLSCMIGDLLDGRSRILFDVLKAVHNHFYPDAHNYAPFGGWRLTIACANEPFLEHLKSSIDDDDSEFFDALRKFHTVSIAHVPESVAVITHRQGLLDDETIKLLRADV